MRLSYFLLIGALALLLGPGEGLTQRPNKGNRQRGQGGRGGGAWGGDPGAAFDKLANGKTEIVINDVQDPRQKGFLGMIARNAKITNGKITKDQYVKAVEQFRARFAGGRFTRGGPPPTGGAATPAGGTSDGQTDQAAEKAFKALDRDGDGKLNESEMDDSLKNEWKQWDKDKDGLINLSEFKAYYKARMAASQKQQWGGGQGGAEAPPPPEEKKPPVYRAGKLPKGIPNWFEKLDTDNDGQIGLYEWVKAGRSVKDFQAIDRNEDGFLTIQEVMRAEKLAKKKGKTAAKNTPAPVTGTLPGPQNQFGRPQGRP